MIHPAKNWHAIDAVAGPEAREALEYGLMESGALGTETIENGDGRLQVIGYFETDPQLEIVRAGLAEALRIYEVAPAALIDLNARQVLDQDWLSEWKKHWQPVVAGRFIITPPWIDPPASATASSEESILIRITPGMAFGTGTHETTRLCLKAIEKHFRGASFLDVGTGTGILAIAAAKMRTDARVEACDVDAEVIEIAKENAALNEVDDAINFRVGSIDEHSASADLVCANLTAPVIMELLPVLLGVTCGHLILSGILDSQLPAVEARLSELGVNQFAVDQDGEWIMLVI
jgi:ribosomal protein L11 methyltransferase